MGPDKVNKVDQSPNHNLSFERISVRRLVEIENRSENGSFLSEAGSFPAIDFILFCISKYQPMLAERSKIA